MLVQKPDGLNTDVLGECVVGRLRGRISKVGDNNPETGMTVKSLRPITRTLTDSALLMPLLTSDHNRCEFTLSRLGNYGD